MNVYNYAPNRQTNRQDILKSDRDRKGCRFDSKIDPWPHPRPHPSSEAPDPLLPPSFKVKHSLPCRLKLKTNTPWRNIGAKWSEHVLDSTSRLSSLWWQLCASSQSASRGAAWNKQTKTKKNPAPQCWSMSLYFRTLTGSIWGWN